MTQQPQDLWQGGPWEQPSPHYPTPPAVVIPPRAPDILRPKRRRPRRALLIFLLVFVLLLGLAVGMLVVRYLLPQETIPRFLKLPSRRIPLVSWSGHKQGQA